MVITRAANNLSVNRDGYRRGIGLTPAGIHEAGRIADRLQCFRATRMPSSGVKQHSVILDAKTALSGTFERSPSSFSLAGVGQG